MAFAAKITESPRQAPGHVIGETRPTSPHLSAREAHSYFRTSKRAVTPRERKHTPPQSGPYLRSQITNGGPNSTDLAFQPPLAAL